MPYHSSCSLYLLPKTTKCCGTEEIPLFPPLILLFSLDLLEFFEGSRDKAGLQAVVCEIQATQIAEFVNLGVFVAGFGDKSQALYATCELLAPCPSTPFERQLGLPK